MRQSTPLFRTLLVAAAAGFFALSAVSTADAEPAPAAGPRCPAPTEASYKFSCMPIGSDTIQICAPSKGCAEQSFDKLGNLVCQKVQYDRQVAPGERLMPTDSGTAATYGLCDQEMALVRTLPPLPMGQLLPPLKS